MKNSIDVLMLRAGIKGEITESSSRMEKKVDYTRKTTAEVRSLDLTARDWQIFSTMEGADQVAENINRIFMEACNKGMSKEEVQNVMNRVMSHYMKYGTTDSEPRHVLSLLMSTVFGGENDTW